MSSNSDEHPKLTREDEDFVRRVAASYAPSPMTPAERAAFDGALQRRIRRGQPARRRLVVAGAGIPAVAAAALAAMWIFFLSPGAERLAPSEQTAPVLSVRAWEEELFLEGGSFESEQTDESELLPDEYLAIASVFLDG